MVSLLLFQPIISSSSYCIYGDMLCVASSEETLYNVLPRKTVDSMEYSIVTSVFKIFMCLLKRKRVNLSELLDLVLSILNLLNSSSVFNIVLQQFYWSPGKETDTATLYHLFMLYKGDHVSCYGNYISKTTECLLKFSNLLKS